MPLQISSTESLSAKGSKICFRIFKPYLFELIDIIINRHELQKDSAECQQIHHQISSHDEGTLTSTQEFPHIIDWSDDGLELEIYNV